MSTPRAGRFARWLRRDPRRVSIGVAIDADRMLAKPHADAPPLRIALDMELPIEARLKAGIAELRARTELTHATLDVALLPGLCKSRVMRLPPLDEASAALVLARDASFYFPRVQEGDRLVATASTTKRAATTSLVAIAAEEVIGAIHEAADAAGWSVRSVVPAMAAWAHAASSRREAALLVLRDDATLGLRVEAGRVVSSRRIPAGTAPVDYTTPGSSAHHAITTLFHDGMAERKPARVSILGPADRASEVLNEVQAAGRTVEHVNADPDELAASLAGATRGFALVTARTRSERSMRNALAARRYAAAAVVTLFTAAGIEAWGTTREIAAVRAQRAAIAGTVMPLIAARDSLVAMYAELEDMSGFTSRSSRWTSVLMDLSSRMPLDAHAVSFRGEGDSILVEGWAAHTGEALDALRAAPGLHALRLAGSVRRETLDDGTAAERFTLEGRIAPARDASRTDRPPASGGTGPKAGSR